MSQIVGATHPGNRDHNEDCFIANASVGLGLVADGMGGYACGEVASELVKDTIADAIANSEGLRDAIVRAHSAVKDAAASDAAKKGMGSTVIAFKLQGQDYELAWVGDSRAYLWDMPTATLHQITRDHSYVETLLSSGAISHAESINHPNRNLITQAVGVAGDEGLEIAHIRGRLGALQQLLICSDGLVDEVLDDEIATLMASAQGLMHAVNSLVEQAVANGGSDNVTVVIGTCEEGTEEALEPEIVRSTQVVPVVRVPELQDDTVPVLEQEAVEEIPVSPTEKPSALLRMSQSLKAMGLDPWVLGAGGALLLVLVLLAVVFI